MTALRRRTLEDLPLRGLAPRTQPCYLEAVQHLAQHDRRPPDHLSGEERRQYFPFLLQEKTVAESTCRLHRYGPRCFYACTRQRPWPGFARVRPQQSQKLPVVLSLQEGRHLLALVDNPTAQMGLQLIDAGGLRLTEGTQLQVAASGAPRMLVWVRQAKGRKERCVPLAPRGLELGRAYWQRARPRPRLFPARQPPAPLSPASRHQTFNAVVRQSGIPNEASSQTLRHSSATHLLARGGSLRGIQARLGHHSPRPTARSAHLTSPTLDLTHAPISARMADLYALRERPCRS